jgi:hypothetical protein
MDKKQERIAESTEKYYRLKLDDKGWPILYRGKGCEVCNGSGYKGRSGCYEVMRLNDEIRELIAADATTAQIRFAAKQSGMIPLKDYSLRLVGEGVTTPDECIRVTFSDTGGEECLCPRCRNPIGDEFFKCPFCQYDLKDTCSRCGTVQEETWESCPKCGLTKAEANMEHTCRTCDAEIYESWHICPYCQSPRVTAASSAAGAVSVGGGD